MGIKLMPCMRGPADAVLYRAAKESHYNHIDALFTGEIHWDLIGTHQRNMIQVMLSIQAGRVMPAFLLRKLGTYSRRSRLCPAFQALGRVKRTLFLLRFFSSTASGAPSALNHQGRGLQRLPGLGVVRQPRRQRRHALHCRRPDARSVRYGSRQAFGHTCPGRFPQPLHAPPYPALRPIRSRYGQAAGPAQPTATSPSGRPCDHSLHVSSTYPCNMQHASRQRMHASCTLGSD